MADAYIIKEIAVNLSPFLLQIRLKLLTRSDLDLESNKLATCHIINLKICQGLAQVIYLI